MTNNSKSHQEFLSRLSELMEANFENEQFGVSELAGALGMSRSNLHRKVNSFLNISASQYIREFRLQKANELLQETSLTVSEITYQVGFGSTSYFIKCFKEYFGHTPGDSENHDKSIEKSKNKNRWKWLGKPGKSDIIVWSIIFILLVNIFFIIWPIINSPKKQEKTIAVLPFINDSMDSTNTYKINGLMGGIINNLSNNPNLVVRSRTTTEKYRGSILTTPEIARELKVNYIIGGSVQTYDSILIKMNIQLTDARSDENIKSWDFQKEVHEVADIDDLQKEIVTSIASQLNAEMQPGENNWYKNYADKKEALYSFWEGEELQRLASIFNDPKLALQAKENFERALKIDSGFVLPMVQLGWICIGRGMQNFDDRALYQDSAYYYARRAIKFDNESSAAYHLLGRLYHVTGNYEKALEAFKTSQQYDEYEPAQNLALLYFDMGKYEKSIDLLYKLYTINMETDSKPNYWILYTLKQRLELLGFYNESKKYTDLILEQNNDSTAWLNNLMHTHLVFGNFDSVKIFADRWMTDDTLKLNWYDNLSWAVPWALLYSGNYEESYDWFQKYRYELAPKENLSFNSDGLAFLYLQSGQTEKADSAFAASIKKLNHQIKIYHWQELAIPHIHLASVYSAMGETEKSMEMLRKNKSFHLLAVTELKFNPMFDHVRDETEFQKILTSMEKKYRKIHDKVAAIVEKYENQN